MKEETIFKYRLGNILAILFANINPNEELKKEYKHRFLKILNRDEQIIYSTYFLKFLGNKPFNEFKTIILTHPEDKKLALEMNSIIKKYTPKILENMAMDSIEDELKNFAAEEFEEILEEEKQGIAKALEIL